MTAHKVEPAIIDPGRKMSIAELVKRLNDGTIIIGKIIYRKGDGYYVYIGRKSDYPDKYEIEEIGEGRVIYRLGSGKRKVWQPGGSAFLRVPAKVKPKEGYVILERLGDRLILYII